MPRKDAAPVEAPVTAEDLRARIVESVTEEREHIREAQHAAQRDARRIQAAHDVELDAWESKAREARAVYQLEPLRPPAPDTSQQRALLHRLMDHSQANNAAESRALGHASREVEAEWSRARVDLAAEAAEALKPLLATLEKVEGWRRFLQECRAAEETQGGGRALNGSSVRMPARLEFSDLLPLAEGVDVLAPAPLPRREEAVPEEREGRRISREEAADTRRRQMNGGRPGA